MAFSPEWHLLIFGRACGPFLLLMLLRSARAVNQPKPRKRRLHEWRDGKQAQKNTGCRCRQPVS
jgi:hypothetical protein